ncbi:MAG: hypothetical protein L0Y44_08995 [Phycisphaerales bacterium]|nr:hypothetical protein [Phycisphaerales bacterium]
MEQWQRPVTNGEGIAFVRNSKGLETHCKHENRRAETGDDQGDLPMNMKQRRDDDRRSANRR